LTTFIIFRDELLKNLSLVDFYDMYCNKFTFIPTLKICNKEKILVLEEMAMFKNTKQLFVNLDISITNKEITPYNGVSF